MEKNNGHIDNISLPKNQPTASDEIQKTTLAEQDSTEYLGPCEEDDLLEEFDSTDKEANDSWNKFKEKYVGKTVFLSEES